MRSCLKFHGGKSPLARRIVALMPAHTHYVEPYAGGLSVLLAKDPEGVSEVANDLDGWVSNFWLCLATPPAFELFRRVMECVPFSEERWGRCKAFMEERGRPTDVVASACAFFVCCRMSMAGRMESFATLSRRRTRRGMNEQAAAWLSAVDGLPEVHERLRRVVILNREATDVIRQQDGPATLHYVDPPYLPETRSVPDVYRHEMTEGQHFELLSLLTREVEGKVMLSGCRSRMYDQVLGGWKRHDFDVPNRAASVIGDRAKVRRMVECVWCNF